MYSPQTKPSKKDSSAIEMETRRIVQDQIKILNSMADDEDRDANKYRSAANYAELPTVKKLFLSLGGEEQVHAQRLRILAAELERGIL